MHEQAPWLGTGAGAYGTLRLHYRVDERTVEHAHGYVVQTLSDLGWIGLAISLFAAGAWLVAAAGAVGVRRRDRGLRWDAERVGVATLAVVAVVFGLHSAIDWTWFVPANALPAMICAGWVVSRPTLRARLGEPLPEEPRVPIRLRAALAAVVVLIAIAASWSALQPVRAAHAQDAALDRFEAGQMAPAESIARIAHRRDPLSVDPLFELASIQQARGNVKGALATLGEAIDLEPANPETWRRLGQTRLMTGDPKGAVQAFRAAYYLDPRSLRSVSDVVVAARAANGVARATSSRRRRVRSSRAVKPLASSVVVSERFVKKRTCWPSGSKCASKRVSAIAAPSIRPWNGTVSSSRPPGLSTRRISLSAPPTSGMCSSTSEHQTRSTDACSSGIAPSSSRRTSAPVSRALRAASSASSTPTAFSSSARKAPAPQPRSSTRSPGRTSASRICLRSANSYGVGFSGASAQNAS